MIVLAILLAQFAHRSNPGAPSSAAATITSNGQCQVVSSGGTNSAMFAVTGTWTGTLGFFGTNDLGVTTIALQGYAVNPATGALNTSSVNTTTGNGVWIADTFGMYSTEICATAAMTGTALVRLDADPASAVVQVTGPGGGPVAVSGSLSVSGTADLVSAGAPTTFNANAICTGSLLLAGEQTAGFELNAGTLTATLTPQCSMEASGANFVNGQFKDATGAATNTLAVASANPQTALQIMCPGGARRAQVCTTAFTSGTATGLANATFFQGASAAGGGGGGAVTQSTAGTLGQSWFMQITDATTGPVAVKAASTLPAATDKALVCTVRDPLPGTQMVQGLGTAGAAAGNVMSCQAPDAVGGMNPFSVATFGANTLAATQVASFAAATNLTTSCASATACAVTASIQWSVAGQTGAEFVVTAVASPVGFTLACDTGYDNNATYLLGDCAFNQAGVFKKTLANADLTAANKFTLSWLGSPSFVRIRVTAVTSGQFTAAGAASTASSLPWPVEAKAPTQATVTLTASTSETTLMAAGGSGVFLDLTYLKCSNTSTTASVISIRDATAGTVRDTLVCPAAIGPCEGNIYRTPFAQTTSNANWTIQAGTSASSIICTAQAVQR